MKQVIVIRMDLTLGKGKTAAQAAHASLQSAEKCRKRHPDVYKKWEWEGQKKVVLEIETEEELLHLYEQVKSKIPAALVKDAGLTQVPPETVTCVGIGPWEDEEIDRYTGDLRLL